MAATIDFRLDNSLAVPLLVKDLNVSYSASVIGAATFDLSGLPKEYLISPSGGDISWVQTIFQALGLQSLLMASLKLEGFSHLVVHGTEHRAIVVKQRLCYTALLVSQTNEEISEPFIQWAKEFEPATLKSDPRFNLA